MTLSAAIRRLFSRSPAVPKPASLLPSTVEFLAEFRAVLRQHGVKGEPAPIPCPASPRACLPAGVVLGVRVWADLSVWTDAAGRAFPRLSWIVDRERRLRFEGEDVDDIVSLATFDSREAALHFAAGFLSEHPSTRVTNRLPVAAPFVLLLGAMLLNGCGLHPPPDACNVHGSAAPADAVVNQPVEVNGFYETTGKVSISTYHWATTAGPGAGAYLDPNLSRHTYVTFDQPGTYTVTFLVDWFSGDGAEHTSSWSGNVIVAPASGG